MLAVLGERPVTSLTSTSGTVALAERTLDYVSKRTQLEGWHFNTEYEVPLVRDANSHIILPSVMMKVDVSPYLYADIDPVIRGSKLYDLAHRTYVFQKDLKATVVYLLDFTELPEAARQYITIKAGRIFQDRYFSDLELAGFAREEEREALLELRRDDGQQSEANIFNNYTAYRILSRNGEQSRGRGFLVNDDRTYMSVQGTGDNIFFEVN